MVMALFPLTAMVYTGSRGGIIACVIGVALYALPYRRSKRKMAAILVATVAVAGIINLVVKDQDTLSRFEMTYDTGDTAGRDKIYAGAIEMISEKPLLGWGPVYIYELALREGKAYKYRNGRDPHNLFLHLLLEAGLLGTAPFLIGLGLCMRAAWTARDRSLGLLPLVWFVTMIVASMSCTSIYYKSLWLVLIVNLASGASAVEKIKIGYPLKAGQLGVGPVR